MTDMNANTAGVNNAVAHLHHQWLTGLVLALITRAGTTAATDFVFRLFRQQQLERFLPGLEKLGLTHEPHAVAAAKYHYFSNQLGGVKVEYYEESSRKAWVRYPPPRWIWWGTAICAIPDEVNHAMMHAWHAHNGVSLNNPNLGFVCTQTTVRGQPGLEGYYFEYDHALSAEERLRFVDNECCPRIDPGSLPELDSAQWSDARKAKANRNYALEYIRNGLPILIALLGEQKARDIGVLCGRQVGMHCYDEIRRLLDSDGLVPRTFIELFHLMLQAAGDDVAIQDNTLTRTRWRLFADGDADRCLTDLWLAPYEGMLAVHDRFARLVDGGNAQWRIEE